MDQAKVEYTVRRADNGEVLYTGEAEVTEAEQGRVLLPVLPELGNYWVEYEVLWPAR